MKKQDKEMVKFIACMAGALIVLFGGSLATETGREGQAIFLIRCSLYMAMWCHAGIVGTLINKKLEDKK